MGLFKHIIQDGFMGKKNPTDVSISVNLLIGHGMLVTFNL